MRLLVKETDEEFLRKENQLRTGSKACGSDELLGSDEGIDDDSKENVMFSEELSRLHGGGEVNDATTAKQKVSSATHEVSNAMLIDLMASVF